MQAIPVSLMSSRAGRARTLENGGQSFVMQQGKARPIQAAPHHRTALGQCMRH